MSKEFPNGSTVITDASCFILLDKLDAFYILERLYHQVITTPEIAAEYGKELPPWVHIQVVKNKALFYEYAQKVDTGEASAIALAFEVMLPTLILDDMDGRKLADQLHFKYTGTIGVLIKAKQEHIIISLKPYFEKIKTTDFRIAPAFLDTLLEQYES
jgi:predicted nucleic acid-binding protein